MLRSELWERIQLCPAFGLKYVEVSCRTNHEVARMERMLLLGLRQLPSLAQIREGQAGGAKGKKGKRKQVAQDKAQELLAAVGLAGVLLNFWADMQRQRFRERKGKGLVPRALQIGT